MEKHPLVIAGSITNLNHGPIIVIMNQYVHAGMRTWKHSLPQMEWDKISVDDKSVKVGGNQCLSTPDGFIISLNIHHRLPYLDMRPFTDEEWDKLPHVILTHKGIWDPSILDHKQSDDTDWFNQFPSTPLLFPMFDEQGDLLRSRLEAQHHDTNPIQ